MSPRIPIIRRPHQGRPTSAAGRDAQTHAPESGEDLPVIEIQDGAGNEEPVETDRENYRENDAQSLYWALPPGLTTGRPSNDKIWEWSLVLSARRIPHKIKTGGLGLEIIVRTPLLDRAVHEVESYETENRGAADPRIKHAFFNNTDTTLWVLIALAMFYSVTQNQWRFLGYDATSNPIDWAQAGSANAYAVLILGEWWRLFTAMTLHADAAHLLANLIFGAMMFIPLMRELGSGAGWSATLLAGAVGNDINCRVHGPGHDSVGASTAVFAAVGVLCAVRAVRDARHSFREFFVPIAGAAALVSFLGVGGERTDLGAHLFGLLAGLGVGAAIGYAIRRWGVPPRSAQWKLGLGAVSALVICWALALK